jgi:nitrous oxide reductase accessory protein NosL
MKKLILILLPAAIFVAACSQPEPAPAPPPQPVAKHTHKAKATSDNPESFRAVEKPSTYGQ